MTDTLPPHATIRTVGPPRLGGKLGRYQLMETLGHGAMATVFRARDTNLGRDVAVKVMTLAVAARADSAERFRREAQAVAAVKHPGIVEVFDFVTAQLDAGEPAYIVSELIEGPTLRKFLDERRGRLLPESAALIALPLAEALHAAHVHGVIHRDIKPDNVMLERLGPVKRVVLADFGVAHVTGLETMTATGALVGSPSYMSPEQGRGDDVGPGSDLFSLGILLYEMSTGHLPFTGRDPLQVLAAIGRGIYKRPGQVSPFVGPAFDEICCRCLRALPGERYASAGALAEALRGFCLGAGLATDGQSLREFLEDPEGFEAALRPKLADASVARARKHARRGELARALAELSRATAYVPGHAEAERLCTSISSRRRWAKGALVLGAVLGVAGSVWAAAPRVRDLVVAWRTPAPPPVVAGAQPVRVPAEAVPVPAPPAKVPAVTVASPRPSLRPRKEVARRASLRKETLPETRATPPVAAEAPPLPAAEPVVTPPVVTPPPVAPAPVDVPVVIFAAKAFCNPGIDAQAPQLSFPVETQVKSGRHRVHCTVPGAPAWSTDVEIGPPVGGGPFVIQIVRGDDLKPRIDWKRTSKAAAPERGTGPAVTPPAPAE